MANQEHLDLLNQGVATWNQWRKEHNDVTPDLRDANLNKADLSGADLVEADLVGSDLEKANLSRANLLRADLRRARLGEARLLGTNLSEANLSKANLQWADLFKADLVGANFEKANLSRASLLRANFSGTNLSGANLVRANLSGTDLSGANFSGANLSRADLSKARLDNTNLSKATLYGTRLEEATLVETNLREATLSSCFVYGISAWNIELKGANQENLIITREGEPTITVDNLVVAQLINLLPNNKEIRIDTAVQQAVLILGSFTYERKRVLHAIRDELRKRSYLPIVCDFDGSASQDLTENISTLANLARFVIADITDAKSIPQELERIVADLPLVPVQLVLQARAQAHGIFEHFTRYPWVLPIYHYSDHASLLRSLEEEVIHPAERKAKELAP